MSHAKNTTMSMFDEKPLLILMDGHAMVHRAWHAIQQPLNVGRTGEDVRAVFGFTNTFLRAIADWNPTHCAIAFDLPTPTFRHKLYKEYKAQRPEAPPELRAQFVWVRKLMDAFRVPIFEVEGYEADDVLGTLSRKAGEKGIEALILTGDTDFLQLVSPWVRVLLYRIQERKVFDEAAVKERYGGLGAGKQPEFKALLGDPSDNIPGVPGIGNKTAIKLLHEFGSLEGIYQDIGRVSPSRLQQTLLDHKEQAFLGKKLVSIVTDLPLDLDPEAARFWRYDRGKVVEILRELEFFSIVPNIPELQAPLTPSYSALPTQMEKAPSDYHTITSREALETLVRELSSSRGFAFDTETTGKDPMSVDLVGLSFSNAAGRGWYVPVGHEEGDQLPREEALGILKPLLENPGVPKVAHNGNYDMTVLENYGIRVQNLEFDTMIAAFLVGRKALGLKALALDYFNEEMTPISDLIGSGRKQVTMAQVPVEQAAPYACADADFTGRLREVLQPELKEKGLPKLLHSVEMPLVPVLVRMQVNGVALDVSLLGRMSEELGLEMSKIETQFYDVVGHRFNVNSSQQLGDVLFKELRLPATKRTKTGYSTDASSLEALKDMINQGKGEGVDPRAVEILDLVLEYRQLGKIKSTYTDSLPALVNPKTGRVHTSYNQTGAATGRVSSNDPNVQNIPVRTEVGRKVRKAFVAQNAPDWTLLGADYSQIELRVLAHLSQDWGLLEAFHRGDDIHAATASQVYGVALNEVTPDMRRIAKIMNFGVIYGLSPFGISQQTGLSHEEGQKFIETYFGRYPGIRGYIDSIKAQIREQGYVETILGRRRDVPEIRSSNFQVRQAAERMAVNMPIQGSAADIIRLTMIRIQERMDALKLRSLMIIQVHDELIFEVPKEELEQMSALVLELMPSAMKLDVPLVVDLKTGPTWGDME